MPNLRRRQRRLCSGRLISFPEEKTPLFMQLGFVLSVYKDSPGQGVKIINIIITFQNFLKLQDRARKELVFMVDKTELPVPFMAGAGKDIDIMSFQVLL